MVNIQINNKLLTIKQLKYKIVTNNKFLSYIEEEEQKYIQKWNSVSEKKNREERDYYYKLYEQKLDVLDYRRKHIEDEIKEICNRFPDVYRDSFFI